MITDANVIVEAIFWQQSHPVVKTFLDYKKARNQTPTKAELTTLLNLIGQGELLKEMDFFMDVYRHRDQQVYCCLDSIQGLLNWYLHDQSKYNLLRQQILWIDTEKIIDRFEALAYLKSAYEVGERRFAFEKKNTKSSIFYTYKHAEKQVDKLEKAGRSTTVEYAYYAELIEKIRTIDIKTKQFLSIKQLDVRNSPCVQEFIYSRPLAFWEVYLLKDLPLFIHLKKELEQSRIERLSYPKAHIIYGLLRCTYLGEQRKFFPIDFINERDKERTDLSKHGILFRDKIITEVKKVIDPVTRKIKELSKQA